MGVARVLDHFHSGTFVEKIPTARADYTPRGSNTTRAGFKTFRMSTFW